jgi:hypothetical protein
MGRSRLEYQPAALLPDGDLSPRDLEFPGIRAAWLWPFLISRALRTDLELGFGVAMAYAEFPPLFHSRGNATHDDYPSSFCLESPATRDLKMAMS